MTDKRIVFDFSDVPVEDRDYESYYGLRLHSIAELGKSVVENTYRNMHSNDYFNFISLAIMALQASDTYVDELELYIKNLEKKCASKNVS